MAPEPAMIGELAARFMDRLEHEYPEGELVDVVVAVEITHPCRDPDCEDCAAGDTHRASTVHVDYHGDRHTAAVGILHRALHGALKD